MKNNDPPSLQADPGNWRLLFFYYAPHDPRIVVRKRLAGTGWTVNFARQLAVPFLSGIATAVYGAFSLLSRFDLSKSAQWVAFFAIIVLITSLCSWMALPRR